MIPIRAPEGRTIAFGGRLLEGDDGPEVPQLARVPALQQERDALRDGPGARRDPQEARRRCSCEGYFDCIGLHQAGVKNAVALCSTALTPGHLALLRARRGEGARAAAGRRRGRPQGRRAAGRRHPRRRAPPPKVALLPEGEDPDTFARRVGADGRAAAARRGAAAHRAPLRHRAARGRAGDASRRRWRRWSGSSRSRPSCRWG